MHRPVAASEPSLPALPILPATLRCSVVLMLRYDLFLTVPHGEEAIVPPLTLQEEVGLGLLDLVMGAVMSDSIEEVLQ